MKRKYYNLTVLRWEHTIAYEGSPFYRGLPTYASPMELNMGWTNRTRYLKLDEAGEPEVVYVEVL